MGARAIEVFFYGLFMDRSLLVEKGLHPLAPRRARLDGYRLYIGERATLLPAPGSSVYGIVMRLPQREIENLYAETSVADYEQHDVAAVLDDGSTLRAVSYLLPAAKLAGANPVYAAKLRELALRLDLPADYVTSITAG